MSNSDRFIRRRGAKVNSRQKKILFQFMVDNPLICARKVTSEFTINHHKAFWQNITTILNVFGPPRKTVESWKKAWKDLRLRYRKVGLDLKDLISTFKGDNVVNTRMLLEKVDNIHTTTRGKVDIEQVLKETLIGEKGPEFILPDCEVEEKDMGDVKLEIDSVMDESKECDTEIKEKSDCDELCEIAYEEVVGSDYEFNDLDCQKAASNKKNSENQNISSSKKNGQVCLEDSDSDNEKPYNLRKKIKLSDNQEDKEIKKEEKKNDSQSTVFTELLSELKQHNKIQREKLALRKSHFEQKKRLLEQTLNVKREIAKAHVLLAKSVKTFVDNISFNT